MLENYSDEKLMSTFCNPQDINHQRAFEVLYQRHKGPLYRFIKKSINNEQDANELFQDLWFKIINNKQQFDPNKNFTTWAYTIARRLLIDQFRKLGRAGEFTDTDVDAVEINESTLIKQPENEFVAKQMARELNNAISYLPIQQRQTFVMRHESNMSLQQIADVTGQAYEQTKSQYRYAVNKLKRALERLL